MASSTGSEDNEDREDKLKMSVCTCFERPGHPAHEDRLPRVERQRGVQHEVSVAQLPGADLDQSEMSIVWSADQSQLTCTGLSLMVGELTQR